MSKTYDLLFTWPNSGIPDCLTDERLPLNVEVAGNLRTLSQIGCDIPLPRKLILWVQVYETL